MKMSIEKNYCARRLRMWRRRHKFEFCLIIIICGTFSFIWLFKESDTATGSSNSACMPIDVVYTWVNGSDPAFIESVRQYDPSYDPTRFDDKNELRYSLRSLELYAPWVRHVYIVTNGQIPYWLDLSYERVTIVPHELLIHDTNVLPTFSSAAIETFLHHIPKLSQRFLYLNDDIFLGAPLYPEDLYTEAEGVRIYQAWMVPDCAEDCPWTYIGDGACDQHCNIAECQHDGGDCAIASILEKSGQETLSEHDVEDVKSNKKYSNATALMALKRFPKIKKLKRKPPMKSLLNNSTNFKQMVQQKNLSTITEIRRIVDSYNHQMKSPKIEATATTTASVAKAHKATKAVSSSYKNSKDIYYHSLIHTNMLLNRRYGFRARNVLGHVGFLLDRQILTAMQEKFAEEIHDTASHRFREPNDLQFAFAYYSFVMSEKEQLTVEEIFDEFDTDASQTWSDREVRTFLVRMYPLPLDWSALRFFEEVIGNCSRDYAHGSRVHENVVYSTLVYERYEDSNLPTIHRDLVLKCPLLVEALETNFAMRPKYKYNINSKRTVHSNFMMLTSNVSEVVDSLDKIRRTPRWVIKLYQRRCVGKFNCINDNLEPQHVEDNELVRHLLEDFYLSFFPRRSKFELPAQFRNRFDNWRDYQRWRRRKRAALWLGYGASVVLVMFLLRFLCMHKAKFVRRYVQKI